MSTVKPIATLKPDWVAPKPPVESCPNCTAPVKPVAYLDEGWVLGGFECENYCNMFDDFDEIEWPFVEDHANSADLEKAGFVIV